MTLALYFKSSKPIEFCVRNRLKCNILISGLSLFAVFVRFHKRSRDV